jgi:hypothetical protein
MQTFTPTGDADAFASFPPGSANNDTGWPRLPAAQPAIPQDAVVRIERPARSAMTSAPADPQDWRLVFERRSAPFVEPLMGWTGSRDPADPARTHVPHPGRRCCLRSTTRPAVYGSPRCTIAAFQRAAGAPSPGLFGRDPGAAGASWVAANVRPGDGRCRPQSSATQRTGGPALRDGYRSRPASLGGRQTLDPHEPRLRRVSPRSACKRRRRNPVVTTAGDRAGNAGA